MSFGRKFTISSFPGAAALALTALAAACSSSTSPSPANPDGAAGAAKGVAAPGLALLSTDYMTATVSLYDPASKTLVDDCVAAADLSKDTALPTGTQGGELVVIDREQSLVDFVDPSDCQIRAKLSVSTGGFKANPHDVVRVSSTKAYVLRYEKNAAPTADPSDYDEGDDLLIVDPTGVKVTGRIDMSSQAAQPAGAAMPVQARPDRALLANGLVYVTLNNLSADFSVAGPGRIVVVDPATDMVKGTIDLPALTGCSGLAYDDAAKHLYVSCGGEYTDADQTATSALVDIDVSGATPAVAKTYGGKSLGTQPVSATAAALLGGRAFVGTAGALDPTTNAMTAPDTLYALALDTGTPTMVTTGGAYNLGRPAVDATSMTLFLPDGDAVTPRIRVFDVSSGAVAGTPFEPNPAQHLPPREAAWY